MLVAALALSVLGLLAGPVLVAAGHGRPRVEPVLEGLTLGLLPALLLTRLLPHVYEELGGVALALCAAGFVALWQADRFGHRAGLRLGAAVIFPALGLHALADGAALAVALRAGRAGAEASAPVLAVALVLHRLPEGLFLARTFAPTAGVRGAFVRVALLAAATVVGALGQRAVLRYLPDAWIDGAVAFGLGGMLRMVLHSHAPAPSEPRARAGAAVAFVLGLAGVLALPSPDSVLTRAQPRELSIVQSLLPLFIETAPSMLLGLTLAGLLHAVLPAQVAGWLRGASTLGQALRGMAFGLPLPLCSCGVLPMVRRLLVAGAPAAAVTAFAIATPELGPGAATLSLRLLGPRFTAVRLVAAAVLAVLVAVLVAWASGRKAFRAVVRGEAQRLAPRVGPAASVTAPPSAAREGLGARLRGALREAFGPTLEHTAAWYVTGLVLAAVFEAAVRPAHAGTPSPWDVWVSAALAVPLYVCAEGATPLAAVLVHKGFSVGAALAFLLVGPGTNVAVLGLVRRSLGKRAMWAYALGSFLLAVLLGYAANALVPASSVPEMHPLVGHDHWHVEWLCAVVLGALLLRSLLRLGPRGWFAQMGGDHEAQGHEHAHAHGDAGAHEPPLDERGPEPATKPSPRPRLRPPRRA